MRLRDIKSLFEHAKTRTLAEFKKTPEAASKFFQEREKRNHVFLLEDRQNQTGCSLLPVKFAEAIGLDTSSAQHLNSTSFIEQAREIIRQTAVAEGGRAPFVIDRRQQPLFVIANTETVTKLYEALMQAREKKNKTEERRHSAIPEFD